MYDSEYFVEWLAMQSPSGILPTQVAAVANIMDRLPTEDLITVMYHGNDEQAFKALNLLRTQFKASMEETHSAYMVQTL